MNSLYISAEFRKKIIKFAFQKAKIGDSMTIKQLFEKKRININVQDEYGSSLLAIAVWNNHYDLANILIEQFSAEIDSKDYKGWTPLMVASYTSNFKMAKLLCEGGANASVKNLQGLNSKDMAKSDELKEYLYQRTQMTSCFDFEKILKIDIEKELDNVYDSESEQENGNPIMESVHEFNQKFEEQIKSSKKNNRMGV